MKHLEQRARDFFEMKRFFYRENEMGPKREYRCINVEISGSKLVLKTAMRSFVFSSDEKYLAFESSVEIIGGNDLQVSANDKKTYNAVVVSGPPQYLETVSTNLYTMFEKLSKGNVSDEELKQMRAAADIVGKICDVEKVKLGYLLKV